MRTRCNNPNYREFQYYGGRGITICDSWNSFESFYEDMGSTYKDNLTIDRIDFNKGYSPDNCRWATPQEQCWNKRMFKLDKDKIKSIRERYVKGNGKDLAKEYGVSSAVISEIINYKRNYANH